MRPVSARVLLQETGCEGRSYASFGRIEHDTSEPARYSSPAASLGDDAPPAELRVDVALVAPAGGDGLDSVVPLLARLRDVHADCVVFHDGHGLATAGDMLGLGFEAKKSPSIDGLLYVRDGAEADRPREWNNSRHWANPENFSRYRW